MDNDQQTPAPAPAPAPDQSTLPAADTQDDQEWAAAGEQFEKEHGNELAPVDKKPEDKKDESKPEDQQTPEEKKAAEDKAAADKKAAEDAEAKKKADEEEAEKVKNETPEQTEARHKKEAEDKRKAEEEAAAAAPGDPTIRNARATQAQLAEDAKAMEADIRAEMFADEVTEIVDSEGEPIRTIEDVQQHINPNTKKPFTEEEAGRWLLAKQQHINKTKEENSAKIKEIAEVNLSLKDQADTVREKWGELLSAMPKLRAELYTEFQKTLTKDEKSGIIIKAPVSLERFYETALRGYAKTAELMQKQEEADQAAKKGQKEQDRKDTRGDRQDIVGGGQADTKSEEDKEWEKAAKAVYEI